MSPSLVGFSLLYFFTIFIYFSPSLLLVSLSVGLSSVSLSFCRPLCLFFSIVTLYWIFSLSFSLSHCIFLDICCPRFSESWDNLAPFLCFRNKGNIQSPVKLQLSPLTVCCLSQASFILCFAAQHASERCPGDVWNGVPIMSSVSLVWVIICFIWLSGSCVLPGTPHHHSLTRKPSTVNPELMPTNASMRYHTPYSEGAPTHTRLAPTSIHPLT